MHLKMCLFQVNCVRSCMNVMLSTDPADRSAVQWGSSGVTKIQREARAVLLRCSVCVCVCVLCCVCLVGECVYL